MTLVVRIGTREDAAGASAILRLAFAQYRPPPDAPVPPPIRAAFERYVDEVADVESRFGEAELWVAVDDGRVVGTGTLYPPGVGAAYAPALTPNAWPKEWASLRLLGVDPAYRGRGVGRRLIEAGLARCRELGAKAGALHTSAAFEVSRDLVTRMGARRVPEHDFTPMSGIRAEAYMIPFDEG